jgi:hypothetical protein
MKLFYFLRMAMLLPAYEDRASAVSTRYTQPGSLHQSQKSDRSQGRLLRIFYRVW